MKKEIFRMINVITNSTEIANLDDMNLHIHQGEIIGLVPINGIGIEMLLETFSGSIPLQFGKIYINNIPLYNRNPDKRLLNKIYVLNQKRKLVDSLSVLENIFVLNKLPFTGLIHREPMILQYSWLMEEFSLNIPPEKLCENLSELDRCIVEILKAITQGSRLIILYGLSDILGDIHLEHFKQLLNLLTQKNYSFLYICSHHEESLNFCDRIVYMKDGRDIQTFDNDEIDSLRFLKFTNSLIYTDCMINSPNPQVALQIRHLPTETTGEFSFEINQGECIVLYDETKELQNEFTEYLKDNHGSLLNLYEIYDCIRHTHLEKSIGRQIAVIGENPLSSMLFYDMSFVDNLCFRMEKKIKRLHITKVIKESLQKEYYPLIGDAIFAKSLNGLSASSLYDLVYYRVSLLNPKAVFIVQPFYNTDIHQKKHIQDLIHMLQKKKIAVIILSADYLDSASIANRRLVLSSNFPEPLSDF